MRPSDPDLVGLRSKTSLEVFVHAALEEFVGDGETNLGLMEFVSRVSTARSRCARLGRLGTARRRRAMARSQPPWREMGSHGWWFSNRGLLRKPRAHG